MLIAALIFGLLGGGAFISTALWKEQMIDIAVSIGTFAVQQPVNFVYLVALIFVALSIYTLVAKMAYIDVRATFKQVGDSESPEKKTIAT